MLIDFSFVSRQLEFADRDVLVFESYILGAALVDVHFARVLLPVLVKANFTATVLFRNFYYFKIISLRNAYVNIREFFYIFYMTVIF